MTSPAAALLLVPLASCARLLGIEVLPITGDGAVDPTADSPANDTPDGPLTGAACAELHAAAPAAPSGLYEIDLGGAPLSVYCDMTTAGGGWTLILAYRHAAADLAVLLPGQAPQDPSTSFSQMSAVQLQSLPFTDLRFFCTTDQTPRVMHFITSVPEIVAYVRGQGPNSAASWMGSTTLLADHTAFLPATTNDFRTGPSTDENMTFFPFMSNNGNQGHWSLRAFTNRWECDDFRTGAEAATLHQIWAR